MKHEFRNNPRRAHVVPPEVVDAELVRIWEEHDKRLLPRDVVDAARPKRNPIHPCFEWNDAAAADEFRLWQARKLIKDVRIVEDSGDERPAFVHVRLVQEENGGNFYQRAETLRERPTEYLAALDEARRKLASAQASFEELRRLARGAKSETDVEKLSAILAALQTARAVAERLQ